MTRRLLSPAFLFLLSVTAIAQNATTSVRGVIKDPQGATISGATVTLVN